VIGDQAPDGRWQLRLWWKPFVPLIWIGGLLVALGGVLALIGRVLSDLKRRHVTARMAERRKEQEALS
jgi:cytochrome c-type biogenesis protein CcmF